jgi:hypothetical protein
MLCGLLRVCGDVLLGWVLRSGSWRTSEMEFLWI